LNWRGVKLLPSSFQGERRQRKEEKHVLQSTKSSPMNERRVNKIKVLLGQNK